MFKNKFNQKNSVGNYKMFSAITETFGSELKTPI